MRVPLGDRIGHTRSHDGIIDRKEPDMPVARARHILVATEAEALDLKQQIADGADFAETARQHSQCPSRMQGGDLGEFMPGQMVAEFNDVCFNDEVGVVHGPVQTRFGYHIIEVTDRRD